jgi:23S rRNA pseudouridine2605 synthase
MEFEATGRGVRLSKLMASRGVASRREAEAWIGEGRVTVNGQTVTQVVEVDPTVDVVRVDGQVLPREPKKAYFLLYKPRGYITGRDDPEGRPSVHDLVEKLGIRLEPVGRLDFDTEGALLMTNDGDLAHSLAHPSKKVPKRYLAKVYRTPSRDQLDLIEQGKVFLEDGKIQPALVRVVDATDKENAWVEITVTEGRNRLVRRIFQQIRHPVSKLRRITFATLSIRGMERGDVRPLTADELRRVFDLADGKRPERAGHVPRKKGFALPKVLRDKIKKQKG